MLDIQFIRDNPEFVQEKSKQKGYEVDIQQLLTLDAERRTRLTQIDELRRRRNEHAAQLKQLQSGKSGNGSAQGGGRPAGDGEGSRAGAVYSTSRPTSDQIAAGKQLKEELTKLEDDLARIDEQYEPLLHSVPNMPIDDVPIGATEDENVVAKKVGEPPVFDFAPKHHWEILEPRDMLDKERAAKIAGSRFGYLKGGLVRLQFAIVQYVMMTLGDESVLRKIIADNNLNLSSKPFTPILPPAMLRTEPYRASSRLNAAEVTYKLEDDDLWLNASAEHTLCTMYWNEILPEEMFPIRYIGFLTSFRREAGTYGKDTEGMIRWHQFDKLEMEVFSTPETGLQEHKFLIAIQEYLVSQLGLPYQVLQKCTADIGKPNARGVDIECWFPAQGRYRETHTADYMTDYQARDLKTRVRRAKLPSEMAGGSMAEISGETSSNSAASFGNQTDQTGQAGKGDKDGKLELVHTNDATAFATNRIMAAIVENYQTADGYVMIPEVLRPYMGGESRI